MHIQRGEQISVSLALFFFLAGPCRCCPGEEMQPQVLLACNLKAIRGVNNLEDLASRHAFHSMIAWLG